MHYFIIFIVFFSDVDYITVICGLGSSIITERESGSALNTRCCCSWRLVMLLFSAGVGRSGTLIALDMLLCEAADTQSIDVLQCIDGLRQQRMYMVQTLVRDGYLLSQ